MKVVVTGATGNVGTAVLKALKQNETVTEISGIARRLPSPDVEPYTDCQWHSIDIGGAATEESAAAELTAAFQGADVVIHLAWLIRPSRDPELMHRVNVDGSRAVLDAAARAQVPHIILASSAGAYSPDTARKSNTGADQLSPLRQEGFPTHGIDSSFYSSHKAEVESILDEFERHNEDVLVTRIRPAFIFQRESASEIERYFLGSLAPTSLLTTGKLPALPLPKGIKVQAVHSDDVAAAYVAAAVKGKAGAFNICADDILCPQELADIVDSGHFTELPASVVRTAVAAAYAAHAIPTEPGWLDMAMNVPLLNNRRAKAELGWQPQHTAAATLQILLEGMNQGTGYDSPLLYPEDANDDVVAPLGETVAAAAAGVEEPVRAGKNLDIELLHLYLADHLTGATAGTDRIRRMANAYQDTQVFPQISALAREIEGDEEFLSKLMDKLGVERRKPREMMAWLGERAGRLKLNGKLLDRSPTSMLLETELMRSAVAGKLGGWETLREHADELGLDPEEFTKLIEGAHRQLEMLTQIHAFVTERAFRKNISVFGPESEGISSAEMDVQ